MFDKLEFAKILNKIVSRYESISEFAHTSTVGRSYISKYINKKIDAPPSPKVLQKIATSSKGEITYDELMKVCGYITYEEITNIKNSLINPPKDSFYTIPILVASDGKLCETNEDMMLPFQWDHTHSYFAFRTNDESMSPLLGIGDIAIIEKTNTFKDEQVCLLSLDNNIIIRTIKDCKSYIELQALNYHFDSIKLNREEMKNKNFSILGKVIKAENESLFKERK